MPIIRILPLGNTPWPAPEKSPKEQLLEALISSNITTINKLLDKYPGLLNCNLGEKYGHNTPLGLVATFSQPHLVKLLLDRGADPTISAPLGYPAFAIACAPQDTDPEKHNAIAEVIQIILTHIKEKDPDSVKSVAEWVSTDGASLLHMLAQEGITDAVIHLLSLTPYLINNTRDDGGTAFSIAVSYGHEATARALYERGADIHLPNNAKITPLSYSLIPTSNASLTTFLLGKGADPNTLDRTHTTPFIEAFKVPKDISQRVASFLPYNPDASIVNVNGMAAISYAVVTGSFEIVKLLRGLNKPPENLIAPPHFHLIISSALTNKETHENEFRMILKELDEQGFSINLPNTKVTVNFTMPKDELWKCDLLREMGAEITIESYKDDIIKVVVSTISENNELSTENTIKWSCSPSYTYPVLPSSEKKPYPQELSNFKQMSHIVKDDFLNEESDGFYEANLALLSTFNQMLDENIVSRLLEDDEFIDFLHGLEKKVFFNQKLKKDIRFHNFSKFLFMSIYHYWKNNDISNIRSIVINYFQTMIVSSIENNSYETASASLGIMAELFENTLQTIIHVNYDITLIKKIKHTITSENLNRIRTSILTVLRKLNETETRNELFYHKILTLVIDYLYISYEYYLSLKASKNYEEAITILNKGLENIDVGMSSLLHLGPAYFDFYTIKSELEECAFEHYFQLASLLDKQPGREEEKIRCANEAKTIIDQKTQKWKSEPDITDKANFIHNIGLKAERKLKKRSNKNASIHSDHTTAPIPPTTTLRNVNTLISQQRVDEIRLENIEQAEKAERLKLKKQIKQEEKDKAAQPKLEPEKKVTPTLVLKWTEAQVREIYKDILRPTDRLALLRNPSNPVGIQGTHWGVFRLLPEDYRELGGYEKDLNAFATETEDGTYSGDISYRGHDVGIIFLNNTYYIRTSKFSRPHGTCYQTEGGDPYLIIFERLVPHQKHQDELEAAKSKPPKPILVAPHPLAGPAPS